MQTGILKPSELFFYSASSDPGLFFYPLSAGHFFCTKGYRVQRDSFDSILILYVVSGSFSLLQNQRVLTAKAGQIALIDCFHPHVYDTDRLSEAYWIHISGSNTNELTEELIKKQGCILSPSSRTPARICELFELIKNREPISEIAGRCGFGDESGFISFFKKQEGISPLKFRNILF